MKALPFRVHVGNGVVVEVEAGIEGEVRVHVSMHDVHVWACLDVERVSTLMMALANWMHEVHPARYEQHRFELDISEGF